MKMSSLLLPACVVLTPLTAVADNTLVTFDDAIGAIGVSAGLGTDTTATTVTRNIVRGVQPPNTPWAITDFQAQVTVDGHITVTGKASCSPEATLSGLRSARLLQVERRSSMFSPHSFAKTPPHSPTAIRTRREFPSLRMATSRSTTCYPLRRRHPPHALHPCC